MLIKAPVGNIDIDFTCIVKLHECIAGILRRTVADPKFVDPDGRYIAYLFMGRFDPGRLIYGICPGGC